MKIELLYSSGSNCSQRVRWALNYKNMEYTVLNNKDLSSDQFRNLSPLSKVPALVVDGKPLAESVAILEFIEEVHPDSPLLPLTPLLRAKVREAVEVINGWVHPIQCSSVPRFFHPEINDQKVREYRRRWLEKSLPVLHDRLLYNESNFAVGSSFTWADLSLIPIYAKALVLGVRSEDFPKFRQHIQHCLSNKKIRESCPIDLIEVLANNGLTV